MTSTNSHNDDSDLDLSFMSTPGHHQHQEENKHGSHMINNGKYDLKLEKSNILMLGPTGSGI